MDNKGTKTQEIRELVELIQKAETLVDQLKRMTETTTTVENWLPWRVKTMQRRLADAKRDLHKLVEEVQAKLANTQRSRRVSWAAVTVGLMEMGLGLGLWEML